MSTIITVTKKASAYIDLEKDTPIDIDVELISNIIPVNETIEIGSTILFFYDGTTMNISETVSQIYRKVRETQKLLFPHTFSQN